MPEYNDGFLYEEEIGARAAGRSVLEYLAGRYRHSTFEEWTVRVADGQVCVDGVAAASATRLRPGQRLSWRRPPWREPRVPLDFAVLHADADLLAIAKPRGLPTMPAGGFLAHTLFARVRRRHPGAVPVHRLGRGTSGVVLFARSPLARRRLARAWQAGEVRRHYRALVRGRLGGDPFVVERPIGPVPHAVLGSVHAVSDGGRAARTAVRALVAGDESSLAAIEITTGRPHQIRIHLAAAGHPLVGDPLYGPDGLPCAGTHALPGDGGYLLHADRVELPHPRSDEPVVVDCLAPPGLRG